MDKLEKALKGLEACIKGDCRENACPYALENECRKSLERDALELLKAQEPRLLTLDELKAYLLIDENGRFPEGYGWEELAQRAPIYIEPRNPTPGVLYWWTAERLRAWALEPYFQKSYGKIRKAWTSRPTDEQREKVKWND